MFYSRLKVVWVTLSMFFGFFSTNVVGAESPLVENVSGDPTHGSTITIIGNGFGAHPDFNDVDAVWRGSRVLAFRINDFDNGELLGPGWSMSGTQEQKDSVILRSPGRSGSGSYMTKFYNNNRYGFIRSLIPGAGTTNYFSFWYKHSASPSPGKIFRVSGEDGNIWLGFGESKPYNIHGVAEITGAGATQWSSPDSVVPGQWHRIEILMRDSPDRAFMVWLDTKLQFSRPDWIPRSPLRIGSLTLPNMLDEPLVGYTNDPEQTSYSFDDIFINGTVARVELGNAPTWAKSTRREIQYPLRWTSGEITVAVNYGGFSGGDDVYIYVVTSEGLVNDSGLPVKLGVPLGASPPKPPAVNVQ